MPSIFALMREAIPSDPRDRRRSMPARPRQYRTEGERRTARYVEELSGIAPEDRERHDSPMRSRRDSASPESSSSRRREVLPSEDCDIDPSDSVSVAHKKRPSARRRPYSFDASAPNASGANTAKLAAVREETVRTIPVRVEAIENLSGSSKTARTPSSARQSFFGALLRRNTTTAVPVAPRLVECLTCGADDVPSTQSAKLSCGHRMCHDCLKRIFEMSVKDPAHMPPKCCMADHIPLKHVDKLFDVRFKKLWNRKYQEYTTKDRIYCPAQGCGHWIRSVYIRTSQGRKYAQCPRCNLKVCTTCHSKLHKSSQCPKDPDLQKFVETAKQEGWQTCYNCSAVVERKEGCNHMTCRCLAEFCMVCAQKWRTCECPWFTHEQVQENAHALDLGLAEVYRAGLDYHVHRYHARRPPQVARSPAPERRESQNRQRSLPRRSPNLERDSDETPRSNDDVRRRRMDPRVAEPFIRHSQERRHERTPSRGSVRDWRRDNRPERRDDHVPAERLRNNVARTDRAGLVTKANCERGRHEGAAETWGIGNGAQHFLNDNFVPDLDHLSIADLGDPAFARRGTRAAGRHRRTRTGDWQDPGDAGLAPDFLGDESVLGAVTRPDTMPRKRR